MSEDERIVRCAIHPAIGIARVGNAPPAQDWREEYYLASEIPGRVADPGPSGFKTEEGAVKRQAARFRIYGYDAEGKVVKEITAADGEICWRVHLANRKAAWYQFHNAMDLKQYALLAPPRNPGYTGEQRRNLVIDPGSRTICGRERRGPSYRFDDGYVRFGDSPVKVSLGELRTDSEGRLIVLGGHGHSASADGSPATTFANNDGWYDDTSDGPVRATIRLGDRVLEAEPAMVAVTPPNFGQGLYGPVTLHDVVYDLFLRQGWIEPPKEISFWEHVYPIFERLAGNQWVNQGVFFLFGAGSPSDLGNPELLARLASPDPSHRAERTALFRWFRQPPTPWDEHPEERAELPPPQPAALPPFYGDGFSEFVGTAIADLALTATQHGWLERWAEGDFVTGERREPPKRFEEIPLAAQPAALDKTPLEECLGGPFHPGIELTWPLRVPRMWLEPFRLNVLPEGESPRDDFGPVLTPEMAIGPEGPLVASGPGTLSRWLGIPWQTDEASCLSGYDFSTYLPMPSFWAARVPNEVLSWGAYQRALEPDLPTAQRLKHFGYRQFWLRDLQGSYQTRINNMVAEWNKVGIVTEQPGPKAEETSGLPARFWVETGRDPLFTRNDPTWRQLLHAERSPEQVQTRKIAEGLEALPEPGAIHPRRREMLRRDRR